MDWLCEFLVLHSVIKERDNDDNGVDDDGVRDDSHSIDVYSVGCQYFSDIPILHTGKEFRVDEVVYCILFNNYRVN